MLRFQYKREVGRLGEVIWRPVADVWFLNTSGEWIELHPYIDSGADITLLPFSFGKLLGWKKSGKRRERIGGIAGAIEVFNISCKVKIGGKKFAIKAAWAQTEEVPALLGRADVFDKFDVMFRQRRKEIIFRDSV